MKRLNRVSEYIWRGEIWNREIWNIETLKREIDGILRCKI